VVVDDPNETHAARWIDACRRAGILVASLHDLGLGADGADLIVDGSVGAMLRTWRSPRQLLGPRYCLVDPCLARRPQARRSRHRAPHVLIALGGGPRAGVALRLGRTLTKRIAGLRVTVAGGFLARAPGRAAAGLEWLPGTTRFASALRAATLVVTGGGITLYECCAAGTPAVAVSVVPAQRPAIEGFRQAGAVVDAGPLRPTRCRLDEIADLACALMQDGAARRRLAARGRQLVDGRGLERVSKALRRLLEEGRQAARPTQARRGGAG
jgi:spore coat polysaccharide biosynthesis predicted glycosyltransferase SpsG